MAWPGRAEQRRLGCRLIEMAQEVLGWKRAAGAQGIRRFWRGAGDRPERARLECTNLLEISPDHLSARSAIGEIAGNQE